MALASILLFAVEIPLWFFSRFVDRKQRIATRTMVFFMRAAAAGHPLWRITVTGREYLPPPPFVVCANHVSYADVFLLAFLHTRLRFVAKAELFSAPFFGWVMAMTRQIAVARGDEASGRAAIARACDALREGTNVVFFPEGRRSTTGELGVFKLGAFRAALAMGVPVVPVVVDGTAAAWPRSGFRLPSVARMRVRVLPPVPAPVVEGQVSDPVALCQQVRAVMEVAMARSG